MPAGLSPRGLEGGEELMLLLPSSAASWLSLAPQLLPCLLLRKKVQFYLGPFNCIVYFVCLFKFLNNSRRQT